MALTKVVVTREYVADHHPAALASFASHLDLIATNLGVRTAQVIAVKTAWSEEDWSLRFGSQVIVVRAVEEVHDYLAVTWPVHKQV